MDLIHVAALIVVLMLALYVVDAVRRPGRSARPLARPDGEPFHAFTREPVPSSEGGAKGDGSEALRHTSEDRAQPHGRERPLGMVRILNDDYALARRRSQ